MKFESRSHDWCGCDISMGVFIIVLSSDVYINLWGPIFRYGFSSIKKEQIANLKIRVNNILERINLIEMLKFIIVYSNDYIPLGLK